MTEQGQHPEEITLPHVSQVEAMAGLGLSAADIACALDIDLEVPKSSYAKPLRLGRIKANSRVAESLYRKATSEGREAVTAAIFWLKARARWKEVSVTEHTGIDGQPIEQVTEIRRTIVSAPPRSTALPGSAPSPAPQRADEDGP
jgi:hypothetical protein